MSSNKKRILVYSTSSLARARYMILFKSLKAQGYEIILCNVAVWDDLANKTKLHPLRDGIALFFKHIIAYFRLFFKYLAAPKHDFVLVPYVSQLDVFFVKPLAFLRGKKVIADIYISLYDTVVNDRKLLKPGNILCRILYAFEWLSIRIPNRLFIDTAGHARQIETLFKLPEGKIHAVFVGAEPAFIRAENPSENYFKREDGTTYVLFYGNISPLHGVETIIAAAEILASKNTSIKFLLIGEGQLSDKIDLMIAQTGFQSVTRISRVPYSQLPYWIRQADICLGVFAANEKTDKVVPNKVFQILASGKPLITGDTIGIREVLDFTSMDNNVFLVPANSPNLLAEKIIEVRNKIETTEMISKPVILKDEDLSSQFEQILL